jgi:hypothetical protein
MSVHTSRQKPPWEVTFSPWKKQNSVETRNRRSRRRHGRDGRSIKRNSFAARPRSCVFPCQVRQRVEGGPHEEKCLFPFCKHLLHTITIRANRPGGNKVSRPAKQSSPSSCCPSSLLVRSRNSVFFFTRTRRRPTTTRQKYAAAATSQPVSDPRITNDNLYKMRPRCRATTTTTNGKYAKRHDPVRSFRTNQLGAPFPAVMEGHEKRNTGPAVGKIGARNSEL